MIAKPKKRKKKSNKALHKQLYEECLNDMPSCQMCGSSYWLQIHHIQYSPIRITEKGKLITLCKTHHDLVHTNEKHYKPILIDMVNKLYGGKK